jgi:tetratricopeptide (TPR) repeat protein
MSGQHSVSFVPYGATDLEADAKNRCASARAFEEVEDFAKAREALGVFYAAEDILLGALPEPSRAEVWLRTGSLLRRVGGRGRAEDELEQANSYLLKALEVFQRRNDIEKAAEALIAMAACYWSLGIYVKSRQLLNDPIFTNLDVPVIKANRLYMLALVARCEASYPEAVFLLREVLACCEQGTSSALTCKYRGALGNALLLLGEKEKKSEHINEALLHYTLASQEAEEVGNDRYAGFIINNVGYIFFKHGRHGEALEHLDRARRIFEGLQDISCIAQVDETRAQVLNAQGCYREAASLLRRSIQTFEITGEAAQQGEALLTLCASLVGLRRHDEAEECAVRASQIYALNEVTNGEGQAHLAIAEILSARQTPPLGKLLQSFARAARLIASEGDVAVLERIERVEQRILELSGQTYIHRLPNASERHEPISEGTLWKDGLTLEEAKARVEEWYLSRLILEHGTLEAIARSLDLTVEGARQKIARYPHLDALRKAMRDSKVTPLGARRTAPARIFRVRLDDEDGHLRPLGPCGGDVIGVERCSTLDVRELGAVEYGGIIYVGYFDAAGKVPKLHSGHEDYPTIECTQGPVTVKGRAVGYWRKGEGNKKMRPLKFS